MSVPLMWRPGWTVREETRLTNELGSRVMEYILNENYRVPYRRIAWPKRSEVRWYLVSEERR